MKNNTLFLVFLEKSSTFGRLPWLMPIPPKVRSQNAAHTTETRNYFQKWLTPYHIPTDTHQ